MKETEPGITIYRLTKACERFPASRGRPRCAKIRATPTRSSNDTTNDSGSMIVLQGSMNEWEDDSSIIAVEFLFHYLAAMCE